MQCLTSTHGKAPSRCQFGNGQVETKVLIAREDWATLAANDIYRHETVTGDAPLGYTDWVLDGDIYSREPAGTETERAAVQHEAYLDALQCTKIQGKLALISAGYWDQYEALIASLLPTMTPAQRVFVEDAQVWNFRDPVLQMFATAIELEESDVVELFELAKTL